MAETTKGKTLSRAQEKAKSYIEEHNVEKIISEMLNSLVHARDPKPIIFMIKYLANLVTEQELKEHGIEVNGPVPQRIPIITFPTFDEKCHSLLKKHLTRELWSNLKKKSTNKGGNIQICVKSGVQRPQGDIGIMATDEEAYKMFGDLFGPIIKDLHPKFDFRYSYKYEEFSMEQFTEHLDKMQDAIEKIKSFKFTAKRNFKNTPFTPLMTRESKLQVERKVVEVLGELYGQYTQLSRLEEKEKQWLSSIGVLVDKDPDHDAAGINDDWPIGRGIFIHDQKQFVVLVNFEDHLEIVTLPEKNNQKDSIKEGLQRLLKLLQTFEKLGYATDPYLGHLSVSPKNLGTAINLEVDIAFHTKMDQHIDKETVDEIEYGRNIQIQNRLNDHKNNDVKLKTLQTLAPNYNEVIQIIDFLDSIKSIAAQDQQQIQQHQIHQDYHPEKSQDHQEHAQEHEESHQQQQHHQQHQKQEQHAQEEHKVEKGHTQEHSQEHVQEKAQEPTHHESHQQKSHEHHQDQHSQDQDRSHHSESLQQQEQQQQQHEHKQDHSHHEESNEQQ